MRIAILIIFLVFSIFLAGESGACVCVNDLRETVDSADALFEGIVVESRIVRKWRRNYRGTSHSTGEELTIEVSRVFRGEVDSTIVLINDMGSCAVGGLYVGRYIYVAAELGSRPGTFKTNQCMFTSVRDFGKSEPSGIQVYLEELEPIVNHHQNREKRIENLLDEKGTPYRHVGQVE